jgi:hypothetical protein
MRNGALEEDSNECARNGNVLKGNDFDPLPAGAPELLLQVPTILSWRNAGNNHT